MTTAPIGHPIGAVCVGEGAGEARPPVRVAGPHAFFLRMAHVTVLLFASYADAFGTRTLDVPVRAPCTVAEVVDAMRTLPGGDRLPSEPLVAVNHVWCAPDTLVHTTDEVAVIPPVAGG